MLSAPSALSTDMAQLLLSSGALPPSSASFSSSCASYLKSPVAEFSDVELAVDGGGLRAHRAVLRQRLPQLLDGVDVHVRLTHSH